MSLAECCGTWLAGTAWPVAVPLERMLVDCARRRAAEILDFEPCGFWMSACGEPGGRRHAVGVGQRMSRRPAVGGAP